MQHHWRDVHVKPGERADWAHSQDQLLVGLEGHDRIEMIDKQRGGPRGLLISSPVPVASCLSRPRINWERTLLCFIVDGKE